uniref:Uncharacterized protein n=1 Tax=uncultured marine virus TaxID=186617 RepID=A0A0F7L5C1_9VIRU|nr:hypothetical protein [uncultured marine virus]
MHAEAAVRRQPMQVPCILVLRLVGGPMLALRAGVDGRVHALDAILVAGVHVPRLALVAGPVDGLDLHTVVNADGVAADGAREHVRGV